MKFDIVTLFPKYFDSPLQESLIAKAIKKKIFSVNIVNLRDFSNLAHRQVDDKPYGGGAGMVLRADVLASCVKSLRKKSSKVILLDPTGVTFTQKSAVELTKEEHIILICGRYEGVDQRFKDKYVDYQLSIGDYILNGGEAAGLVVLEAIVRLLPGTVSNASSLENESFSAKDGSLRLDFPHFTRPEEFEGESVPQVLLSGDHKKIATWRHDKSLEVTKKLRPDLLK